MFNLKTVKHGKSSFSPLIIAGIFKELDNGKSAEKD